jgi:hypothetical protein
MRRIALCLAATLSLVILPAARAVSAGIHPGLKVGVTVAHFDYVSISSSTQDLNSRSQATFGGYLRLDVSRICSLQPELQYVPGGAEGTFVVEDGVTPTPVDGTLKMNYLEFPLLVMFRLPGAGALTPNFYVAPSVAVNLTSKLDADLTALGISPEDGEVDIKDEVQSLLFRGAVGAGLDMRAGNGIVTLDVRYSRSLSDIFKGATEGGSAGLFDAADADDSSLSVTLGYAF